MTRISQYLTLEEATKSPNASRLGIDNTPNEEQLGNMKYVATEIFDKVRDYVAGPLHASSFFRSKALNDATPGSSKTSQHMTGEAIDIDTDTFKNGTNLYIFSYIKNDLVFDQLILEYPDAKGNPAWIHVSLKRPPGKNRHQILVKLKDKYIPFSEYKIGMV